MTTPEGKKQPGRELGVQRDLTREQVVELLRRGGFAVPQDSSQRLRGKSPYLTDYDPHTSEPEL